MGAVEFIQQLLPEEGFAVGKWSIADAAVTPFLARGEVILKNDIGKYEEGKGKAAWAKVESDPKYARFRKYLADVKSRDSFKETFYPVGFSLLLSDLQSFEPHSCNRTMSRKDFPSSMVEAVPSKSLDDGHNLTVCEALATICIFCNLFKSLFIYFSGIP